VSIVIHREITLDEKRCYNCGRWWAIEAYMTGTCPNCAGDELKKVCAERAHMRKVIQGLRGALKRWRK
jgi:predicted  nucleic acid-binding Zn-ribbon protein